MTACLCQTNATTNTRLPLTNTQTDLIKPQTDWLYGGNQSELAVFTNDIATCKYLELVLLYLVLRSNYISVLVIIGQWFSA